MPELAEVEFYRRRWSPGIGARVLAITLHARKRIFRGTDTRELQGRLLGSVFLRSTAHGKQMLLEFSGNNWLGLHLGMSGQLRSEPPNFRPDKHDHLVLHQPERALVFCDPRLFGRVRFQHGELHPAWWPAALPRIGERRFSRAWVNSFLERHSRAPIKAVLLRQDGFPGVGNWMADEILWRAKIRPARRVSDLDTPARDALVRETRSVCRESLRIIAEDFSDPPPSWLIHQRWKRDGICPRHKTRLRRETIGGRTTASCPRCQS